MPFDDPQLAFSTTGFLNRNVGRQHAEALCQSFLDKIASESETDAAESSTEGGSEAGEGPHLLSETPDGGFGFIVIDRVMPEDRPESSSVR